MGTCRGLDFISRHLTHCPQINSIPHICTSHHIYLCPAEPDVLCCPWGIALPRPCSLRKLGLLRVGYKEAPPPSSSAPSPFPFLSCALLPLSLHDTLAFGFSSFPSPDSLFFCIASLLGVVATLPPLPIGFLLLLRAVVDKRMPPHHCGPPTTASLHRAHLSGQLPVPPPPAAMLPAAYNKRHATPSPAPSQHEDPTATKRQQAGEKTVPPGAWREE